MNAMKIPMVFLLAIIFAGLLLAIGFLGPGHVASAQQGARQTLALEGLERAFAEIPGRAEK